MRRPYHAGNLSSRLFGQDKMSIPYSPAGFKREMRFLEIVQGFVRAVFAVMRRQDGGSPCGGSLGEAPLPCEVADAL